MPNVNYAAVAPEMFLLFGICAVLLVDVFLREDQKNGTYVLSMLVLIGTAVVTVWTAPGAQVVTFSGSFVTAAAAVSVTKGSITAAR